MTANASAIAEVVGSRSRKVPGGHGRCDVLRLGCVRHAFGRLTNGRLDPAGSFREVEIGKRPAGVLGDVTLAGQQA